MSCDVVAVVGCYLKYLKRMKFEDCSVAAADHLFFLSFPEIMQENTQNHCFLPGKGIDFNFKFHCHKKVSPTHLEQI